MESFLTQWEMGTKAVNIEARVVRARTLPKNLLTKSGVASSMAGKKQRRASNRTSSERAKRRSVRWQIGQPKMIAV